jgi:hypothetical protein
MKRKKQQTWTPCETCGGRRKDCPGVQFWSICQGQLHHAGFERHVSMPTPDELIAREWDWMAWREDFCAHQEGDFPTKDEIHKVSDMVFAGESLYAPGSVYAIFTPTPMSKAV